jgi:hypothetical protein
MRGFVFTVALLALPALALADGLEAAPGVSVHVAYAHTWAEPTLGNTAVWNGGAGGSAGFQVPLARGASVGPEFAYDRYPREPFLGVPGVTLAGGGALHVASVVAMTRLFAPGSAYRGWFGEVGIGAGYVHEETSRFHDSRSGAASSSVGGSWLATALAVGAGYRTRPILGSLCFEIGARHLLLAMAIRGVRDAPIRIGLSS